MFKKKSVVMKMVNDDQLNLEPSEPISYSEIIQEAVKSFGTLIVVYVAADTTRQVALHILKRFV